MDQGIIALLERIDADTAFAFTEISNKALQKSLTPADAKTVGECYISLCLEPHRAAMLLLEPFFTITERRHFGPVIGAANSQVLSQLLADSAFEKSALVISLTQRHHPEQLRHIDEGAFTQTLASVTDSLLQAFEQIDQGNDAFMPRFRLLAKSYTNLIRAAAVESRWFRHIDEDALVSIIMATNKVYNGRQGTNYHLTELICHLQVCPELLMAAGADVLNRQGRTIAEAVLSAHDCSALDDLMRYVSLTRHYPELKEGIRELMPQIGSKCEEFADAHAVNLFIAEVRRSAPDLWEALTAETSLSVQMGSRAKANLRPVQNTGSSLSL